MKVAFYGANRVAKDFYYVLKDTEMEAALCFADAGEDSAGFAQGTGLETVPVASLPARRESFDMLVVCDFSHEEKERSRRRRSIIGGLTRLLNICWRIISVTLARMISRICRKSLHSMITKWICPAAVGRIFFVDRRRISRIAACISMCSARRACGGFMAISG